MSQTWRRGVRYVTSPHVGLFSVGSTFLGLEVYYIYMLNRKLRDRRCTVDVRLTYLSWLKVAFQFS